jgi:hypothetical protein
VNTAGLFGRRLAQRQSKYSRWTRHPGDPGAAQRGLEGPQQRARTAHEHGHPRGSSSASIAHLARQLDVPVRDVIVAEEPAPLDR